MTSRSLQETRGAHGRARHRAVLFSLTHRHTSENRSRSCTPSTHTFTFRCTVYCMYAVSTAVTRQSYKCTLHPAAQHDEYCWCLSLSETELESMHVVLAIKLSSCHYGVTTRDAHLTRYMSRPSCCHDVTHKTGNTSQRRQKRTEPPAQPCRF